MVHDYEYEDEETDVIEEDSEDQLDNDGIDAHEQAFLQGLDEDWEESEEKEEEDFEATE